MSKFNYLRNIVANLGQLNLAANLDPNTPSVITEHTLQNIPFVKAKLGPGQIVGIRKEAAGSLYHLTDTIFTGSADYQHGTTFGELFDEVSDFIIKKFGEWNPSTIGDAEVCALDDRIASWFQEKVVSAHLYIPCAISTVHAVPLTVGPISFTHINDFLVQEHGFIEKLGVMFDPLLDSMRSQGAFWMATVDVIGCIKNRAEELGDLAVDIALVGLQLVMPPDYSQRITRMTARTLPPVRKTVALINGLVSGTFANQQSGVGIGPGLLEQWLISGKSVLQSVGNRIAGYLSGKTSFPKLEQAWCDAAYWFHEGLAEPLDTIAVPKLETALEVLMRAESSKGSKARLLQAIKVYYGLDANQFINPHSQITVEKFASDFVRDRSRILHGTWSTLNTHMRDSRSDLGVIVRNVLAAWTIDIDTFVRDASALDETEHFLSWAYARRQTTP
jgi:hypothetical protein